MTSDQFHQEAERKKTAFVNDICRKVFSLSGQDPDVEVIKNNLNGMHFSTVTYAHHAVLHSTQERFVDSLVSMIRMNTEEQVKRQSIFWELWEARFTMSVNKGMVFKYVDAPMDGSLSTEDLAPYVAKAFALCALAETFWEVTGNVNRVREIEELHPDYIELFTDHADRALELALLMYSRKAIQIDDLKYHLGLHPAVSGGAL